MKNDLVELEVGDGIAWLSLNRPAALNALSLDMVGRFADRVKSLRGRRDVRVVVTRGAGRAFCAGSDIRELAGLPARDAGAAESRHAEAFAMLGTLPQPTIAMLHGYVLGGGLGLALYHDFRIAAADAILALPEVELGWTPPWAMGRLAHVVGHGSACWLAMGCERLSGARAAALGLVNDAVGPGRLEARVAAFAGHLKGMPAAGLAETKRLLGRMSPLLSPRWDALANQAFQRCYSQPGARRSVAAFCRRRPKGT
jgi:enoyl-CoA hydratase/carnithine racemase